jgi:surfactin synthase thioesterase subunit/aryl carrier-like protein
VDVSYFNCYEKIELTNIPIGKPIDNIKLYIIDNRNKLQIMGVPGELCISGDGLSRGYLNNPKLTAEKFIQSSFTGGERMYRTGDLARWLTDGNIEFLGRIDHQVKLRGFRIELGEIESTLLKKQTIREAVVIDRTDEHGSKYLCAYIVAEEEVTLGELRENLLKTLPEYMVPAYFMQLDSLPLTSNGKINRKELPAPEGNIKSVAVYEAPRNEVEERLQRDWQEVLNNEEIGINDNFFELGGDSIKAIRLVGKVKGKGKYEYSLMDLYKNPTIKMLYTNSLCKNEEQEGYGYLHKLTSDTPSGGMNLVCIPYGGGVSIVYKALADKLTAKLKNYSVYSVNLPGHDINDETVEYQNTIDIAKACVEEIKAKKINNISLYGHCVGTALTINLAQLLESEGIRVEGVYLGGAFLPKFTIFTNKAKDPWANHSDLEILKFLRNAGGFKDEMEEQELKFVMDSFRHDVRSSMEFYYTSTHLNKISKIKAPIHCIIGDADPLTKKYSKRYKGWKAFSDNVALHVIKGGNHYFIKDQAQELAEIIFRAYEKN